MWLIPICLLAGVILSYLFYFLKARGDEIPGLIRVLLFSFRSLVLGILLFFLVSPKLRTASKVVENPILIVGLDNTQSVSQLTDSNHLAEFRSELGRFLGKAKEVFDLKLYSFGSENREINSLVEWQHREQLTDISSFLLEMESRYANRNTASLLLFSDGNYNKGSNPLYLQSSFQYPIFTVSLGDTSLRRDAAITDLRHNKLSYLGNSFDVSVSVKADLLKEERARLSIYKNGALVDQRELRFTKDKDFLELKIKLQSDELGLQRYEAVLETEVNELSLANNRKSFFVDVLEGRKEVLILALAPHPDVAAMRNAINKSANFNAISYVIDDFNESYEKYSLLILVGMDRASLTKIRKMSSEIPIFYIHTRQSDVNAFNDLALGMTYKNFRGQYNQVSARLNPNFLIFSPGEETERFSDYPPLICPLTDIGISGQDHSLFYQDIGKVQTNYPLITFNEQTGRKNAFVNGEGLWRWRLFDFARNGSTNGFDALIQKFVQYLSSRDDKSRFRVDVEPAFFENESVIFNAEYYDQSYTLRNDLKATLEVRDSEGNNFNYEFFTPGSTYRADIGRLKDGNYTWQASIDDGTEKLMKSGSMVIMPLQLEKNNLHVNHDLLLNVSSRHGGKMHYMDDLDALWSELDTINFKPELHVTEKFRDIISIELLFFLVLLLLAAEWSVRKYFGLT